MTLNYQATSKLVVEDVTAEEISSGKIHSITASSTGFNQMLTSILQQIYQKVPRSVNDNSIELLLFNCH